MAEARYLILDFDNKIFFTCEGNVYQRWSERSWIQQLLMAIEGWPTGRVKSYNRMMMTRASEIESFTTGDWYDIDQNRQDRLSHNFSFAETLVPTACAVIARMLDQKFRQ